MKKILLFLSIFLFFGFSGGPNDDNEITMIFFVIILVCISVGIPIYVIIQDSSKNKRLKLINKAKLEFEDLSSIKEFGDDKCRFYFDVSNKKVVIMRFRMSGVQKKYVDNFEFCGEQLYLQKDPYFCIYDNKNSQVLTGRYDSEDLDYEVNKIGNKENNAHSSIVPKLTLVQSYISVGFYITTFALIEENQGLIALSRNGRLDKTFYYVDDVSAKTGSQSFVVDRSIGNYLFIMDDFFHKLVIVTPDTYEIFNYTDIIEISYEEDGTALFTKSAARTVGGALVGGALLGEAGAVIGGLSGGSAQHKEVNSMQIKILLRNVEKTTYVLDFKQRSSTLKTSSDSDAGFYKMYLKDAMAAKDLLSVIIDKAQQLNVASQQPVGEKTSDFSVADELTKLARLKKEGFLTDEEFEAQKKKLLES